MLVYLFLSFATVESKMAGFIVGGSQVSIKDWPFIAFLLANRDNQSIGACGGSLISSQTILTAAHCLDDVTNKKKYFGEISYTVNMGHRLYKKAKMHRNVTDYKTHEKYDPDDVYFDIGVMFLDKPVEFSATVKKVLLMTQDMRGSMAAEGGLAVAGWGKYSCFSRKLRDRVALFNEDSLPIYHSVTPDSYISDFLKTLNQTVIDQELCYSYINETELPVGIFCGGTTGEVNETEYAYSGDSGGPLARTRDQFLAGLVSWRMETHGLTVYTSVPYYYSWIEETQKQLFEQHCP